MTSRRLLNIVLGADKYAYALKEALREYLMGRDDVHVTDVGVGSADADIPYYKTADAVGARVAGGEFERGILVCGTGMGMCIIANKHPGVFAAVCENVEAAVKSRSINNSNVLTLGGFVTPPAEAIKIVDAWLAAKFTQDFEPDLQSWLRGSMDDIAEIERQVFRQGEPE
ncbi:MAG: RpiB/LacA/LacB family sugar-phosphate isomerase [Myxococcota bacterium]